MEILPEQSLLFILWLDSFFLIFFADSFKVVLVNTNTQGNVLQAILDVYKIMQYPCIRLLYKNEK